MFSVGPRLHVQMHIPSKTALPERLFANRAAVEIPGFNAQVSLCARRRGLRRGQRGPPTPEDTDTNHRPTSPQPDDGRAPGDALPLAFCYR